MMVTLDSSSQRFLAAMQAIDARLEKAQREISSGLKLAAASDDPDHVGVALALRTQLAATTQIRANLGRVQAETDTAEQALAAATKLLDRVRTLGIQGATGTATPASRETLGVEVGAALEQLVNTAATQVEGRYVFSGDDDQQAPYRIDETWPNGVAQQVIADATRRVMHPAGTTFAVSRTALEIFDAAGASVFAAVHSLAEALSGVPTVPADDPAYQAQFDAQTAAIDAALTALSGAQEHLSEELSFYGTVQNRVREALTAAAKLETQQKAELSAVVDADLTVAATELMLATTHRQAAMEARAKQPRGSLFDYLG